MFQASKKSFSGHKDSGESLVTPSADEADMPLRRLQEKCRYNARVSDLTPPSTVSATEGRRSDGLNHQTSELKKAESPSKEVTKAGEKIELGKDDSDGGGMLSDHELKLASDDRYAQKLEDRCFVNLGKMY